MTGIMDIIISYRCTNPMCAKLHTAYIDAQDHDLQNEREIVEAQVIDDMGNLLEQHGVKMDAIVAIHMVPKTMPIVEALERFAKLSHTPIAIRGRIITS